MNYELAWTPPAFKGRKGTFQVLKSGGADIRRSIGY